ncbi:GDSL-type esterase/lipase family protein [Streptomyces sp. NPDC051561]|uniref:GDSL-type esterase/lipase family protein n=1 Tax=Streptomyces sp. NPDC051561 TaxID=3365658 RepID=UPI0037B672C9
MTAGRGREVARRGLLTGAAGIAGAAGLAAVTATGSPAQAEPPAWPAAIRPSWVTSWATAQTAPTPADTVAHQGVTGAVFRAVARLSAGGRRVRLRYGHAFGAVPVRIGPVTAGGRPVTFGGEREAWLYAGASLTSDPVAGLRVATGSDLTVETALPGPTGPLSFHRNTHASHWIDGVRTTSVFLLTGVDVAEPVAPSDTVFGGPVAVFGDSIAEGVGTPDDANLRWPDQFARRFPGVAVANLGVSGNRLLLDDVRFGPGGQARFDRDVRALPGLRTLIVALGVNDLQQEPNQRDPGRFVAAYRQLVVRGHDAGARVVGGTITPFEGWVRWSPELDAVRQEVNRVLRSGRVFDAVADFDLAVRDPARPARLLPGYDTGDHLHPNAAGATALAGAVGRRAVGLD